MIKSEQFISIKESFLSQVKKSFTSYTSRFRRDDPDYNKHIQLKIFHTQKVCSEILEIGRSFNMTNEQLAFAEAIALLHDVGRFEQYDKYNTFSDADSENHSVIGMRVIEQENILISFSPLQAKILKQAIMNHNIPRVPTGEGPQADFYSCLLRDADKLDIWRLALEMNVFHKIEKEKLPDHYEVPAMLLDRFTEKTIITIDMVNSFYDSVLFRLSWVYDINFDRTFQLIVERGLASKLIQKLPPSEKLNSILVLVNDYLIRNSLAISGNITI